MDLKLGHYNRDGIEVIDVAGTIDIYTAPRLRELLIDLVSTNNCQLIVNLEKVEFLDSTGLGVLVGGLKRVRAHDGSLDLVCTQERILKIFRITGLTKVFGIHESVDQAIAATRGTGKERVTGGEIAEGFGAIGGGRGHTPGLRGETVLARLPGTPALRRLLRQSPGGARPGRAAASDHVEIVRFSTPTTRGLSTLQG